MEVLLELFWVFFRIGLFTFGGGYAMIPMIQDLVVDEYGWVGAEEIMNFIAISESTPGPFAINMATFVGTSQYGLLGAIVATIAVILPSFIIILIIAKLFANFSNNKFVKAALGGIRPVVIGLISVVGITLVYTHALPNGILDNVVVEWRYLVLVAICLAIKFKFKKLSPIYLVLISAGLGLLLYSI